MERYFTGVAASDGIAIGLVYKIDNTSIEVPYNVIKESQIDEEKSRYRDAVAYCCAQVREQIKRCNEKERADILKSHLAILEDPYMEQLTMKYIEELHCVEHAIALATEEIVAAFETLDDELIKQRIDDIRDESRRMLRYLLKQEKPELVNLKQPVVVIARDLAPSETAAMDFSKVLGFVTELGGRTSHTSIMARSAEVPAVVGVNGIFSAAKDGDTVILDGLNGTVILNPVQDTLACYKEKQKQLLSERKRLMQLKTMPAVTLDGKRVEIAANIGAEKECLRALEMGAEGIGLLRTEFLYMENTRFPSEDEQFAAYRYVAKNMENRPVIIRTLDIGGDKDLPYHSFPHEDNPFLGCRAIRFCLTREQLFKVQLRAILRASAFGKVRIMYPMVVSVEEVLSCRRILRTCMDELENEGKHFDPDIEVGIMVETPAAVLMADTLIKHVDFFSIGSNDLTQYLLAADRGNESVRYLYNPFDPAVLRSIKKVIDASHKVGKWTGMCGEFASEPRAVPLLLGMGLDEFSVSPSSIPVIKEIIRNARYEDAAELAKEILALETVSEVEKRLGHL
ncbi:MAG: phosphoenolpyruvate--protein phosphotransferase [Bacillota bacterium]